MSRKSPEQIEREVREAEFKLPEARRVLMALPGVIDVSVGIKETGGFATGDVVFQVLVEKKKALQDLPSEQRIPERIFEILTDVIPDEIVHLETVLMGGGDIKGGGGSGTLGAVVLATAANTTVPVDTPLVLTNKHVGGNIGDLVGENSTCDCKCSTCCDFGRVVDSDITSQVDAAIARMNNGVRFSQEIILIGAVRGSVAAAVGNIVVKHGSSTQFTRGQVTSITANVTRDDGVNMPNEIRVAPVTGVPDMSEGGDSGSVYVKESTSEIIGLHHSGLGTAAFGNHIAPVLTRLNISVPVMGTAGAIPLVSAGLPEDGPTFHQAWAALKNDLERTEAGQYWIQLVRSHASEVNYLINHDRETKMAWHRTQGPSFVSHYLKSVRQEDYRVPREIGGMRVENVIISMAAALRQNGSQELSTDITDHYLEVLQFIGKEDSARKLCERAREEIKCPRNQAHSNN